MSRRDYLSGGQVHLVEWTGTFLGHILTGFAQFGLSEMQAQDYKATRDRFITLYNESQDEGTRTRVVISRKNAAKKTLVNATRMLVRVCEAWPQMTNDLRILLGIPTKNPRPAPKPVTNARPYLKIISIDGREVLVGLQSSKGERSKPAGVDSANVFVAYGEEAPADQSAWSLYTGTNRSRVMLVLDKVESATRVWISAQWLNRRKNAGPACSPVSVDLAAMSVVPEVQTMKVKKAA
jgi:hypothetical protein